MEKVIVHRALDRLFSPRGTLAHGMAVFPVYYKVRWRLMDGDAPDMPSVPTEADPILDRYEAAFPYPIHAVGLLVAIDGAMVGGDVFQNAPMAERYWRCLIHQYARLACGLLDQAAVVPTVQPDEILRAARNSVVECVGGEVRLVGRSGVSGTAVIRQERAVHIVLTVKEAA